MSLETKEKTIALDGIEFNIYTQRFDDGRLYVGAWAVDIEDRKKFRVWNSEEIKPHDITWEEWINYEDN